MDVCSYSKSWVLATRSLTIQALRGIISLFVEKGRQKARYVDKNGAWMRSEDVKMRINGLNRRVNMYADVKVG